MLNTRRCFDVGSHQYVLDIVVGNVGKVTDYRRINQSCGTISSNGGHLNVVMDIRWKLKEHVIINTIKIMTNQAYIESCDIVLSINGDEELI